MLAHRPCPIVIAAFYHTLKSTTAQQTRFAPAGRLLLCIVCCITPTSSALSACLRYLSRLFWSAPCIHALHRPLPPHLGGASDAEAHHSGNPSAGGWHSRHHATSTSARQALMEATGSNSIRERQHGRNGIREHRRPGTPTSRVAPELRQGALPHSQGYVTTKTLGQSRSQGYVPAHRNSGVNGVRECQPHGATNDIRQRRHRGPLRVRRRRRGRS